MPWDKAAPDCKDYELFLEGDYMNRPPWSKLETIPLSLIKAILNPLPSARLTIPQIADHRWLKTPLKSTPLISGIPFILFM